MLISCHGRSGNGKAGHQEIGWLCRSASRSPCWAASAARLGRPTARAPQKRVRQDDNDDEEEEVKLRGARDNLTWW